MSLINFGAGISQMGASVADSAGQAGLLAQKAQLETQKEILANQLAEGRETRLQVLRHGQDLENIGAQGEQSRQTVGAQGEQERQNIEAQGGQQRTTLDYQNKLPMTEAERAADKARNRAIDVSLLEATKPVSGGYTGVFNVYDPKTRTWSVQAPAGGASEAAAPDPSAKNITGQTGLSSGAFNYLIGNTSAIPRDAMSRKQAQNEANEFLKRSGTDMASLQSQFKAYNNVLQTNLQKSNSMEILNKEVQGTVQNLAPVADKLGGGNLRWTKDGAQFLGGLANDPNAQQYAFYLGQLRADLAGFNAISGGKMDQHGNAHADDSDFRAAERVIKAGLDSGGARGLAAAVDATGAKNRAIVDNAIDDANRGIWGLFGVGDNYKPHHAQTGAPDIHAPSGKPMPKAGEVQDGFKFLGGDPANPKSWQKVQ